jgi:hypothetical protein
LRPHRSEKKGSDSRPLSSPAAEARFRIADPPPTRRAVKVVHLDRVTDADLTDVATSDVVVMVVSVGSDAQAARTIGETCSNRRITTATVVVKKPNTTDAALSATLAQVRPWSLMVVITSDESFLEDLVKSLR